MRVIIINSKSVICTSNQARAPMQHRRRAGGGGVRPPPHCRRLRRGGVPACHSIATPTRTGKGGLAGPGHAVLGWFTFHVLLSHVDKIHQRHARARAARPTAWPGPPHAISPRDRACAGPGAAGWSWRHGGVAADGAAAAGAVATGIIPAAGVGKNLEKAGIAICRRRECICTIHL